MHKITTTDIAKALGLSQTTISAVLNNNPKIAISEATRIRVLSAASEMGYQKQARLTNATQKKRGAHVASKVIGLMMPNLNNLFFTTAMRNIEHYASLRGYEVVVCNIENERENQRLRTLVDSGVVGIIVAYTPRDIELIKAINRALPVVIMGESSSDCGIHTIGINGYKCGEIIASHLYELGHRNIAYLTAPIHNISLTRPRHVDGAHTFLSGKGCPNGLLVIEDENETENDDIYEFETGYRLTRKLLESRHPFTAIMASDMLTPGIYAVLHDAQLRIPEDISVVGTDNTVVGQIVSPMLTSVDHHLQERCRLAVDRLVESAEAEKRQVEGYLVEYGPSLIVRHSTAMCNANRQFM